MPHPLGMWHFYYPLKNNENLVFLIDSKYLCFIKKHQVSLENFIFLSFYFLTSFRPKGTD